MKNRQAGIPDFEIEEVFAEESAVFPIKQSDGESAGTAIEECLTDGVKTMKQVPLAFDDLGISFGAPFISKDLYEEFVMDLLHVHTRSDFFYSEAADKWTVKASPEAKYSIYNRFDYGTARMDAIKIIEHMMNNQVPKVRKKKGNTYVLDVEETAKAQEKQSAIEAEFAQWINASEQRRRSIRNSYSRMFQANRLRQYDGSVLHLPDLNPAVNLYPHQKNAVLRIILEKDVLLNHAVGSGKTFEIIVGIHERRRRGISARNLVVVPNHMLAAFEDAHRLLFPEDRFLVITPGDFTPAKRDAALRRIQTEDAVAVYMAYSSFSLIPLSRQYRMDRMAEQIRIAQASAASALAAKDRKTASQYRRQVSHLEEKQKKMREEECEDENGLTFDRLGITTLAVDEIQNFKNITISTRLEGIVGMHAGGSKMSDDMMEKVQYVRQQGGGVIFATGTPITNSLSDIYTLQRYLQPEQLKFLKIDSFDKWVLTFAKKQSEVEVDISGCHFILKSRFSGFYNLPELVSIFSNVCDTYCGEDSGMGLPICSGRIDTVLQKSPEQKEYLELLDLRNDLVCERLVGPEEDNCLKITKDGRLMALDIRLAEPEAKPERSTGKVYACAANIYDCYRPPPGTSPLVFCDIGTPKTGFYIYDELKSILIEMGIPGQEIAYVHDAKTEAARRRLFAEVNEARVRVLIGSTAKMGTGVNVQNRLIALHHLDIPWKPSDVTQREGRLIRPGNQNPEVYIYRYITEGTFDAYSWQILENKKRFIDQFTEISLLNRHMQDISDTVLNYAEIKALAMGNPLLKRRARAANLLETAKLKRKQRDEEIRELRSYVAQSPGKMKALFAYQTCVEKDKRNYEAHRTEVPRDIRAEFGERLLLALNNHVQKQTEEFFDSVFGFQVLLPAKMESEKPFVLLSGTGTNRYQVSMKNAKALGCVQRIKNCLEQFDRTVWQLKDQIKKEQEQKREAQRILTEGNPYGEEVERLEGILEWLDEKLILAAL